MTKQVMDKRENYRQWYRHEEADNREHAIDLAIGLAWHDDTDGCDPVNLAHHLSVLAVTLEQERDLAGELAEIDDRSGEFVARVAAAWTGLTANDRINIRHVSEDLYNVLGALSTAHSIGRA